MGQNKLINIYSRNLVKVFHLFLLFVCFGFFGGFFGTSKTMAVYLLAFTIGSCFYNMVKKTAVLTCTD